MTIDLDSIARRVEVDNRIPIRYYYRIADNLLKQVFHSFYFHSKCLFIHPKIELGLGQIFWKKEPSRRPIQDPFLLLICINSLQVFLYILLTNSHAKEKLQSLLHLLLMTVCQIHATQDQFDRIVFGLSYNLSTMRCRTQLN